jgi:AraC-like DNA-binding protein
MNSFALAIPTVYIRQIVAEIGDSGVDGRQWLERNGIDFDRLSDPTLTLPATAFRRLILDVILLAREPALGLRIGAKLKLKAHGVLGWVAMHSSTLRQAADVFARYVTLRMSLVAIRVDVDGRDFRIVCDETSPLGDLRRPILEAVLLSVKNMLDQISAELRVQPVERAAFVFAAPDYASQYAKCFGCPVRFGQGWTGLVLPLSIVDRPLALGDPVAFREAEKLCRSEMENLRHLTSWSAHVRRLLDEDRHGFPSLTSVAKRLHLSPRTLHRRLRAEGSAYKVLLEERRHREAVEELSRSKVSIQEIAFALGYADMASFRRAFKRWEGVAPSQYRRNSRKT